MLFLLDQLLERVLVGRVLSNFEAAVTADNPARGEVRREQYTAPQRKTK
jgi:hypothetical protein